MWGCEYRPLEHPEPIDVGTGMEHMKLRGANIDVFWHNTIASVPHTKPTLIIGHEFLDALPIQKFQYTKKGWREILIDLKEHLDWDEGDIYRHPLQPETKTVIPSNEESVGPVEFKEILCPHNNLAATAMLGGLFEGEHVEQDLDKKESGSVAFCMQCSFCKSSQTTKETTGRGTKEVRRLGQCFRKASIFVYTTCKRGRNAITIETVGECSHNRGY